MAVSRMRNASGHNYRNSSFIVDLAMGEIPRYTERISIVVIIIIIVITAEKLPINFCFSS